MYHDIQICPVRAGQSFRPAESTRAETAGWKVRWSPPALLGGPPFETVQLGFSRPSSPVSTPLPRAGRRVATGALWQRQSQISWKWISAALAIH